MLGDKESEKKLIRAAKLLVETVRRNHGDLDTAIERGDVEDIELAYEDAKEALEHIFGESMGLPQ